ncbi:hypothetical protein B0H13DRAFT_1875051 [Mycena leptocephala]|nr:hypothetical protein B0H13DRAFT_1875051 [Mycena leptocephala]
MTNGEATSSTDDASSSQQLAPLADVEEEMEVILLVQQAWAGRLIPLKDGYTKNASPSNSSRIVVKRPAKRTTPKPATPAKRPPTTQPDSGCPIRALKRQRLTNVYKGHQPVVDKSSLPSGAIQPKSRHRGIEGIGDCVNAHFRVYVGGTIALLPVTRHKIICCPTLLTNKGSADFFEEVYLVNVQSRRKLMHRPMRDVTVWGDVAVGLILGLTFPNLEKSFVTIVKAVSILKGGQIYWFGKLLCERQGNPISECTPNGL